MMNISNMSLHIYSSPNVNRPEATENDKDDWLLVVFVIGIIVFIISCISFFILYFYRKRKSEFFLNKIIYVTVFVYIDQRFSLSNIFSVMLECFSGKRSTSNEGTLIELEELEERKSLISDTENEKGFSNKSEYNIVIITHICMKPYGER